MPPIGLGEEAGTGLGRRNEARRNSDGRRSLFEGDDNFQIFSDSERCRAIPTRDGVVCLSNQALPPACDPKNENVEIRGPWSELAYDF